MSAEARKRDPKLVEEVISMVESGMGSMEIIEKVRSAQGPETTSVSEDVPIPEEIKVIAQALAFRVPTQSDLKEIVAVLKSAYSSEIRGPESFRSDKTAIEEDVVANLLSDSSYQWCVAEVPNGKGYVPDGAIIGVCCYSTDGVSRKNGAVEGNLGSIRYLGVLPQFLGLCVGFRLLYRVESTMLNTFKCVRSMVCIPSARKSLLKWIVRRDYQKAGEMKYPDGLGHKLVDSNVSLVVFVKPLQNDLVADSIEKERILMLNGNNTTYTSTKVEEEEEEEERAPVGSGRNMHLSPIWRQGVVPPSKTSGQRELSMVAAGKDDDDEIYDGTPDLAID